ncbi:MAG: esterase-like activity of phytase family protein [Rhizobiales bacterium]|nr:esterase-like activity of phytase family protein [Hyphomicrobiales bacterium]
MVRRACDNRDASARTAETSRVTVRRFALAVVCATLGLLLSEVLAQAPKHAEPPIRIEVEARPIASFNARDATQKFFGALEFRGGLELTSPNKEFGGLSGIRLNSDGTRFLAVNDKGRWFAGHIVYRGGVPQALAGVETAPILGADGRALAARGWFDVESIAQDGGTVYVGVERVHQIVRFNYGKEGLLARGAPIAVPPEFKTLPRNKSIECLVIPQKGMPLAGTLIAISERGLDTAGNILGFLIDGPSFRNFTVRRLDEYDVSDCATTPDADLLILERRASWIRGLAIRIRRVPLSSVQPGKVLDGLVLVEADLGYNIDNMEGLSAHRGPDGEIVLTIVSDDNFSGLQRTLLLQFVLLER